MPNPTPGDVHINTPLTNMSVAYVQDATNFVATRVFPTIPVQKQSDLYFVYDQADFARDEMRERAPGTEAAGGGYELDTASYSARRHSFRKDIDDETRANSDSPLQSDRDATIFVTQKALIRRERLWATKYFGTSIWGTDITGVASSVGAGEVLQWNDAASTPIQDIKSGKATILQNTGHEPNVLTIGYQVWVQLSDHPDIVDRVKYTGTRENPAMVDLAAVASLLGIDRLEIMKAVYNTADRGQAASMSFIGGKSALLCYANPRPSIMQPSAGYTFNWAGLTGAGNEGLRIKRYRMEHLSSDRVEIDMAFDQKLVAADMGYFFTTVVA